MVAAQLIQRVPAIVEPLRDGRLCITTVVALSKVLTPENAQDVLPRFFQLSKTQARDVVAELRPEAAAPSRDVVTAAPRKDAPALGLSFSAPDLGHAVVHPANQTPARAPEVAVPEAVPPRPSVDPVTADASRLHVTVSRRFLTKLDAARAALSHSHPGAGMEEVLEAGLDLLLDRHAKRKGLVKVPRPEPRPSAPGHVPAHARRAVWTRDGGKCQWPLDSGGVCGSAHRVQIDHRIARARGGPPTVENLRCLCRAHNLLAAREAYGDEVMDRYCRNPRAGTAA